jgi:hypothetical protein
MGSLIYFDTKHSIRLYKTIFSAQENKIFKLNDFHNKDNNGNKIKNDTKS